MLVGLMFIYKKGNLLSMARHRPRRAGKNDKIPYYIVGALVLVLIFFAFPKTGLFTGSKILTDQATITFESKSAVDKDGITMDKDGPYNVGDVITAKVTLEDFKNIMFVSENSVVLIHINLS